MITFSSAIIYLDDYVTAKYHGKSIPYEFDQDTKNLIQIYYMNYYRDGLFKDPVITKIFTSSYFKNLAKEILLKYENDQDQDFVGLQNEFIDTLEFSVHFGNHQTFLAMMHQLKQIDDYFPSFSEEITWELFYSAGQYKVRGRYEGKPIQMEGHADINGDVTIDTFLDYMCTKIYLGDIEKVIKGNEDPNNYVEIPGGNCKNYLKKEDTIAETILNRPPRKFDDRHSSCNLDSDSTFLDLDVHAKTIGNKGKKSSK